MKVEKMILFDSPEAAQYKTGIEGWVSSNGRFWGKDERAARYDGSTHHTCECGELAERSYTCCQKCRAKNQKERYSKLPFKEWDGKEAICTHDGDKYFFSEDDLIEWLYDNELSGNDVMLLICDPIGYDTVDYDSICQEPHEDWEPETELTKALNDFNTIIKSLPAHSYKPGKIRTSYDYTYTPEKDVV